MSFRQVFVNHWIAGDFGIETAFENAPYTPTNGVPYAELRLLENDITGLDLSQHNITDGLFRIILRYPVGEGTGAADAMVQEIFDHFRIGLRISFGGRSATIENQQTQPGVAEAGWYVLVVTLGYRAKLVR